MTLLSYLSVSNLRNQNGEKPFADLLIRRLQRFGSLSAAEKIVIENATTFYRDVEDGYDLAYEEDTLSYCPVLLQGFACSYKLFESGHRHIIAFHVPSDFCGLNAVLLKRMDYGIRTLTRAKIVFIPRVTIIEWISQHAGLTQLLWRSTLIDAAVSREWIVNVGRRTAYQRTAHLFCEFSLRMRSTALARGWTCEMPFTQAELADALGLTPVHLNRTIQWLRSDGLIELGGGNLTVRNWDKLQEAAGFNPTYLNLESA